METYVKIGTSEYPATVMGRMADPAWDGRTTKTIHLTMGIADALSLFVTGARWSIVTKDYAIKPQTDAEGNLVLGEDGQPVMETTPIITEFDNSEYAVAGPITDNRDGTVDVKMGKYTNEEILLMEVLA